MRETGEVDRVFGRKGFAWCLEMNPLVTSLAQAAKGTKTPFPPPKLPQRKSVYIYRCTYLGEIKKEEEKNE